MKRSQAEMNEKYATRKVPAAESTAVEVEPIFPWPVMFPTVRLTLSAALVMTIYQLQQVVEC